MKENNHSGILNFKDKEFYYWDNFLGRSLEDAEKLAIELRKLDFDGGHIYSSGLNKLLNPTENNIRDEETQAVFLDVMGASGFKVNSLWNKIYPRGPSNAPKPL